MFLLASTFWCRVRFFWGGIFLVSLGRSVSVKIFPLRTAFCVSHIFWKIAFPFSFVRRYLWISYSIFLLTHWLFSSTLFILRWYVSSFLLVVSSFILFWSKMMLDVISVSLNLLRLVLWPNRFLCPGACTMWTWKNLYFAGLVLHDIYKVQLLWYGIWGQCFLVDLLSGWCLHQWTQGVKFPYLILVFSVSPCLIINICFM